MINFFRKFRQTHFMENKTGKYIQYALGEIVLVVIGILIALQINNWNEARKAKIVEENFFENILLDLEKDEQKLSYYQEFHTKRIEYLDTLLTYVRNPNKTMSIEKFGMYIEPLYYSANPTIYSSTFESAKAMGTFSSFKEKELLKELSQYYDEFNQLESTFSSIQRFVETQFEPLMYTLPESYMTKETGNMVINEENVLGFYEKIASIKDYRNLTVDGERILRTPKFENYLIGDMGRTYNAVGKITARQIMLIQLKESITKNNLKK